MLRWKYRANTELKIYYKIFYFYYFIVLSGVDFFLNSPSCFITLAVGLTWGFAGIGGNLKKKKKTQAKKGGGGRGDTITDFVSVAQNIPTNATFYLTYVIQYIKIICVVGISS